METGGMTLFIKGEGGGGGGGGRRGGDEEEEDYISK
jgi:hypothetical protein